MTPRQRFEREATRRRNLAERIVAQALARAQRRADQKAGLPDPLAKAREAKRGWRGPPPPPVNVVLIALGRKEKA